MERHESEEAILLDGEVEIVQQGVVEREDSSFHMHLKYLKERLNTVEAVMSLKLMKKKVVTYSKRMLWVSEKDIHLMLCLKECIPITEEREQFLHETYGRKKGVQGKSIKKEIDYGIVDTSEGLREMMQSIGKLGVLGCVVYVNENGGVNFPSLMVVPSLRRMKIVHVSGELKGKMPDKISILWIKGNSIKWSGALPTKLNTLILECCGDAEQFCNGIDSIHSLKVIIILCRSFKCKCYEKISGIVSEWFPQRLVIVSDNQYDGEALTHQVSYQKRMMERKKSDGIP